MVKTIILQGDRFGGALDGAARQFSEAIDKGWSPMQFVNEMRKQGKHIMGIGHRVKSVSFGWILLGGGGEISSFHGPESIEIPQNFRSTIRTSVSRS